MRYLIRNQNSSIRKKKKRKLKGIRREDSGKIHPARRTATAVVPVLMKFITAEAFDLFFAVDNPNDETFAKIIFSAV